MKRIVFLFVIFILLFLIIRGFISPIIEYGFIILILFFSYLFLFFSIYLKVKYKSLVCLFFIVFLILYSYLNLYPKYKLQQKRLNVLVTEFKELQKHKFSKIHIKASTGRGGYGEGAVVIKDKHIINKFVNSLKKCKRIDDFKGKTNFYYITFFKNDYKFSIFFHKDKLNKFNGIQIYKQPYFDVFKESKSGEFYNFFCKEFGDLIIKYVDDYISNRKYLNE